MTSTFRLGRVAGVEIGVNWSWLLIVVLLAWSLADGVFPETNPGLSDRAYAAMALVAVPVFFACLLAHELGHAWQARRDGMEIDGITLWLFGGVARFKGRFPSAGAELRVALAGPAVSAVLGAVLLTAALAIPLPAAVDGTVHWLGYINLALLAFNLLPALPLDGGRVLRAALWLRSGDFVTATRAAAGVAGGAARAMIVGGIALSLLGGGVGGLWLAFIGWFLLMAAAAEDEDARTHEALAGVTVADVMVRDPVTVHADTTLATFLSSVVLTHRHTAYPVVDADGTPAGVVTYRAAGGPFTDLAGVTVDERMTPLARCLVVAPDAPLADVLPELLAHADRRALVLDGARLAGLLTATDAVRAFELRELAEPRHATPV